MDKLPRDCSLLPISGGALLVSREHAVFCRVPAGETEAVRDAVAGRAPLTALSTPLLDDLERHGFFGPRRPARPDRPSVQIQLTNACNLACAYGCTNSGRPRRREVGHAKLRQVVRQIPELMGARAGVALLGGEPLLTPWCLDLAAEIVDLGLDLTIFTNGVRLPDDGVAEKVAGLVQCGAEVRVSLAGPTQPTCDAVSAADRFEAAVRGLRRLAHFGGRAKVDLMLLPGDVDAVARDLPALRKRLPPGTPIALGVPYMSGRETGDHLFASHVELEAALNRVAFEAGEAVAAPSPSPLTWRREGCGCALGRHVHIRSDGALFNCFKMEEQVGHLDRAGFPAAVREVREHPHRAASLETCADCPLATLCGGGCRSENLLYTGNPDQPPCGPWRVRVISELLAEDRVAVVEWRVAFLLEEARSRGIETPPGLVPRHPSRHLMEV
jgi:radical SAM protein with 4Fe4S-binding SPASM domain